MSQPCVTSPIRSEALQTLLTENSELQKYLVAQRAVITSLERRVGRSLETLGVHLQHLTAIDQTPTGWHRHLDSVQNEVDCLCDLISDTMLLQKLEAGKVAVMLEPIELPTLLMSVSRHLLECKDGTTPRLLHEIAPDLPGVLADRELTEAVILDLVARGLKYSDSHLPVVLSAVQVGDRVHIGVTTQRFAPAGDRDSATEIALCCRRIEVQNGEVTCQPLSNGLQMVTISLPVAPGFASCRD